MKTRLVLVPETSDTECLAVARLLSNEAGVLALPYVRRDLPVSVEFEHLIVTVLPVGRCVGSCDFIGPTAALICTDSTDSANNPAGSVTLRHLCKWTQAACGGALGVVCMQRWQPNPCFRELLACSLGIDTESVAVLPNISATALARAGSDERAVALARAHLVETVKDLIAQTEIASVWAVGMLLPDTFRQPSQCTEWPMLLGGNVDLVKMILRMV